jgi:DNA-binding NarL/FixJ family response regulator
MPIKVLIVEDQEIFRQGLTTALADIDYIQIVGEATNGAEAVAQAKANKPDVVLMDMNMPVMQGDEATQAIKAFDANIRVVALTINEDYDSLRRMNIAGAEAYLIKTASKTEIVKAIETVYEGNAYYCSNTQQRLNKMMQDSVKGYTPEQIKNMFTTREMQVLNGLCAYKHTKQIASELDLSARTIEGIKAKLQEKMDVADSVGIVLYAVKYGLVKL